MTEATTEAGLATPLPSLAERYRQVRQWTEQLCSPLATEDYVIQSMPDASPARWHLAHTTWFFETFVLKPFVPDYQPYHPLYEFLFNSYYNAVGAQYPRPERGLLSRPTVSEVYQYRSHVDHASAGLHRDRRFAGAAWRAWKRPWSSASTMNSSTRNCS